MKIRNAMIGLMLTLAAGCDTMDKDVDSQALSINNDPAYFLPGTDGFIDLPSRVIAPGKIKVEISGFTSNGVLKDLGNGLIKYSPAAGSLKDSFRFRVLDNDDRVLAEDTIGIIIPTDTTQLPCTYVYTRNDSATNVTSAVTIDVTANDYSCAGSLSVSVNTAPTHGTATVVGNKIQYVPNGTFTGFDQFIYKATVSNPSVPAAYGLVTITGRRDSIPTDTTTTHGCTPLAVDDIFYKPLNDTSVMALDILANDSICADRTTVDILYGPRHGTAYYDTYAKKIWYKNGFTNIGDTLTYQLTGLANYTTATVVIKRQ